MDRQRLESMEPRDQVAWILRTMAEVVAEFGEDYRYTGQCQYVCTIDPTQDIYTATDDGLRPDCIVGQVLSRLGWELGVMQRDNATPIATAPWAKGLSPIARKVLHVAQTSQDARMSMGVTNDARWSVALLRAQGAAQALIDTI